MKAILPTIIVNNGRHFDNKEQIEYINVVTVGANGKLHNPVCVRMWMGRSRAASVVYCSVWIHAPGISCAGHGQAGGYGYHKQSAALQFALDRA
jgi:hypothetical protein